MLTEDMSTTNHHILERDEHTSAKRRELLEVLEDAIQDNGNTNVLLVHAIAQHIGLSAAEFECWALIRDHGPFTAGELAKRCHITTGGMTGMIDRLERRNYVKREADPNDRRRVLVRTIHNEAAFKKVRELYDPLQKSFNELIASYNDEELAFILAFMTRTNGLFHAAVESLPHKVSSEK
jgi:DNA-binding MarR family transcriptional regulator